MTPGSGSVVLVPARQATARVYIRQPLLPLEASAEKARAGRTALDNIRTVVDELLTLSDSDSVRSIALQRGIFTHDVPPSDLKVVLDPLIEHLKGLGRQRYANIRMAIGQLDVPYDAIPKTAAPLFRQLERGEAVSLDASVMKLSCHCSSAAAPWSSTCSAVTVCNRCCSPFIRISEGVSITAALLRPPSRAICS